MPFPTQRFMGETERLYGILDKALEGKDYLVGNKYTIADIANFSSANAASLGGIDLKQFPNVERWWAKINARPAVQRGTNIPNPPSSFNEGYRKQYSNDEEFRSKEDHLRELGKEAKEQSSYKYTSP